jgi:hypothetical protein
MKRKIKITVCLLFMFVSFNSLAQISTLEKLMNKTWVRIYDNQGDWSFKQNYTTTVLTETLYYQGKTITAESYFYLSDQIETTFDNSKVGNVTDGKYIISFIPEWDGNSYFKVWEIMIITETYLEIKSLKSGNILKFNIQ